MGDRSSFYCLRQENASSRLLMNLIKLIHRYTRFTMKQWVFTIGILLLGDLGSGAIAQTISPAISQATEPPAAQPTASDQPANPVQKLLKTKQCARCNLQGADLSGVDLSSSNLIGANLQNANLQGSNLGVSNLEGANLQGANLSNAYLYRANLKAANFSQAILNQAYLRESILTGTNFRAAQLQNIDLSQMDLAGLQFEDADLRGANLSKINGFAIEPRPSDSAYAGSQAYGWFWIGGTLGNTHLSQLICSQVNTDSDRSPLDDWNSLPKDFEIRSVNFQGANLQGANLQDVLLIKANLSKSNLSNANLSRACLAGSNLQDAVVTGADFNQSQVRGAQLSGVNWQQAQNASALQSQGFNPKVSRVGQREGRQYVGTMNRAQQAYLLEYNQFANTIPKLAIGIQEETKHYLYRVFRTAKADRAAMNVAIPKVQGLKTYLGLVNVSFGRNSQERTTFAVLCESQEAKPLLPKWSEIKLPAQGEIPCPAGFTKIAR